MDADPVAVVENLGMDVIDVATNFVGILAMSQVIHSIHSPMDIWHELWSNAPDHRLSFLVAALQGVQEAEYMAVSRPLIPATYYAFIRGVATTGSLIGIWSHFANFTHLKRRSKEDLGKHIAISALMGGTTAAAAVVLYKARG